MLVLGRQDCRPPSYPVGMNLGDLPELLVLLASDSGLVRRLALAHIDVPDLPERASDAFGILSPTQQRRNAEVLERLGASGILFKVSALLEDADPRVRAEAWDALRRLASSSGSFLGKRFFEAGGVGLLLADKEEFLRFRINFLKEAGARDYMLADRCIPRLCALLSHADDDVQKDAAAILVRLSHSDVELQSEIERCGAVPRLVSMLDGKDYRWRKKVDHAVGTEGKVGDWIFARAGRRRWDAR